MCKPWMIGLLVTCQMLALCVAGAQEDQTIQLRSLTLSPMPEAREALKYRLSPRAYELQNTNAAILYQSAAAWCPEGDDDDLDDKIDQWRDMPIKDLPRDDVLAALGRFRASFRSIELATSRGRCEWDMPMEEGFSMLLPSLSTFRKMAFALSVKTRLQVADGQTDEALATITHGLAMGRGIAQGPTLVQDLVGISISAMMFKNTSELMGSPNAPNLYWALTELAVPYVDFRQSMGYEYDMMYWEIPELRDLEGETLSEAQASALVGKTFKRFSDAGLGEQEFLGLLPMAWVMLHYADAKLFLTDRGMAASRFEAMPAAQAVILYQFKEFREVRDSVFKWLALPYSQYRVHAEQHNKAIRTVSQRGSKTNLFAMYLPGLSRCRFLGARLCRDIDILRVIEALRLHAAANQGAFPKTLDEVTLVPIPVDPVSGQPFVYTYRGSRHVRLEAPEVREQTKKRPVFELTMNP
jgi:hypothetical protein